MCGQNILRHVAPSLALRCNSEIWSYGLPYSDLKRRGDYRFKEAFCDLKDVYCLTAVKKCIAAAKTSA